MASELGDTARNRSDPRPGDADGSDSGASSGETNLDLAIRAGSAVLGGALLVRGLGSLRERSLRGAAMTVAGGFLLSRAVGGGGDRLAGVLRSRRTDEGTMAERAESDESATAGPTEITHTMTVGKPADELYETWRDPEAISRVMGHFADVRPVNDGLHWTVRAPGGRKLTWETRFVEEEPGELLRWTTPGDALLPNEGTIRFREAPGDRGTMVTLTVRFDPPGGALGDAALRRLDVVPETLVTEALRRFKRLSETGEIPTTAEGNPSARGRGDRL